MTDTMVERVARAMFNRRFPNIDFDTLAGTGALGAGAKAYKNDFRADARAAIAAMREPTAAMLKSVMYDMVGDRMAVSDAELHADGKAVWEKMIDEALKDG